MEVEHGRIAGATVKDAGKLSGDPTVGNMMLDQVLVSDGVRIADAVFNPGSRTYWHTHSEGQIFFIEHGRGAIGTRDDVRQVQAGDVVYTPPGEEHWHGASPDSMFVYRVISLGDTDFLEEPVDDAQYAAAWQEPLDHD